MVKGSKEDLLDPCILDNLQAFRGVSKLKKVALNVFVKMLDATDLEKLSKAFIALDKEATGMITKKDFKETITKVRPIL